MTDPDTSAAGVERLILSISGALGYTEHWGSVPHVENTLRALAAENAALRAEVERLREALRGHQIWESAEKVEPDEFVLWTPDGQVCLRLKVTHHHERLDPAGVEFVTCDLLDLLNALAALAQKDHER